MYCLHYGSATTGSFKPLCLKGIADVCLSGLKLFKIIFVGENARNWQLLKIISLLNKLYFIHNAYINICFNVMFHFFIS